MQFPKILAVVDAFQVTDVLVEFFRGDACAKTNDVTDPLH